MSIADIFTATPAEIDGEIASIEAGIAETCAALDATRKNIARAEKDSYAAHLFPLAESQARLEELSTRLTGLVDEKRPYTEEYSRRGGWSRFYLVDNSNGHLHTHTACSTCYDTTQFCWMTEMSGMTHAEAVEQGGELSCLACFPEHRAEIEAGRPAQIETPNQKKSREERALAEAARAAKQAKAAKKAIANPDGTPLVIEDSGKRVLKTEIAASRAATQAAFDLLWYGTSHPMAAEWQANVEAILPALAHKRGTTVEHERAELAKKTEAKYRREMR